MIEQISLEKYVDVELDVRLLSEVDHLNRLRSYDGSFNDRDLEEIHENLITAVKEAAVPFAVSTTHQEYRDGSFYWLDQSPEDVAFSGYKFHEHQSAYERVDVEVEEAINVNLNLKPGIFKVFISPRMSDIDAPYEIAKQEHLANDDQIRIHSLNIGDDGNVIGKFMQSMLIKDIPLSAWVSLLQDKNNIFGKSIAVTDDGSALSVMKTHAELEIPEAQLANGVLDIARSTLDYMDDADRLKVEQQLDLFSADQSKIHEKSELIAARWLGFEIELANSLEHGYATLEITEFIASLSGSWNEYIENLIQDRTDKDGNLAIDRLLALELEKAKRNTLWVSAAVSVGNQDIIDQIGYKNSKLIADNEVKINTMTYAGDLDYITLNHMSNMNNNLIARQNISIGSGCGGAVKGAFLINSIDNYQMNATQQKDWIWTMGKCIVGSCSSKGSIVKVGPCNVCESCQNKFDKLEI